MGKSLAEKISELSPEARKRVGERTATLVSQELALRDLRKAMSKTQVEIARKLDIGQVAVSRIEQRSDLMISTLRSYLRAMGADLELRAVFKDRTAVKLTNLSELAHAPKPRAKQAKPLSGGYAKSSAARKARRAEVEA